MTALGAFFLFVALGVLGVALTIATERLDQARKAAEEWRAAYNNYTYYIQAYRAWYEGSDSRQPMQPTTPPYFFTWEK